MQMLKFYKPSLAVLALSMVMASWFTRCAHPVAPTGGEKDIDPPSVTRSIPANYTTNFNQEKIVVEFDEFIQLKDPAKEIFVSPPMVRKPEYSVRGKNLVIQLKEKLREDITYVVHFGSAIVDITENNPIKGFSYVFSTGASIDSLLIAGKVLNAFDLQPVENILVSVYRAGQDTLPLDSMPFKIPPISATRTLAEGIFELTNLPGGEYFLFCLEDLNSNYYYDLPGERIGFLDTLIVPEYIEREVDTTEDATGDQMTLQTGVSTLHPVTLLLFQEFDSTQRLLSSGINADGAAQLAFRRPAREVSIRPLNFVEYEGWKLEEYSREGDTLTFWPTDLSRDTFELELSAAGGIMDTLRLVRKRKDAGGPLRKKAETKNTLKYKTSTAAGILEPSREFMITFDEPVTRSDFSGIWLVTSTDSLQPEVNFTDSLKRRLVVDFPWAEDESYRLIIPDSVFTGVSGRTNDSLSLEIRTKSLSEYGSLIMTFELGETLGSGIIVEFLNEKESVLYKHFLDATAMIQYRYLKPGVYKIKLVVDKNGNHQWDTGNLLKKIQPEKVLYFEKQITVRSNWELEETWKLD